MSHKIGYLMDETRFPFSRSLNRTTTDLISGSTGDKLVQFYDRQLEGSKLLTTVNRR